MARFIKLFVAVVFLAGLVFLPAEQAVNAQSKKTIIKPTTTFRPATTKSRAKIYKVQVRSPLWRAVAVAPNPVAASVVKSTLKRQGWNVQTRPNVAGQVAIRARMMSWRTRAILANPTTAVQAAAFLQAQGFQVRVL
jgi:hypothetical protein